LNYFLLPLTDEVITNKKYKGMVNRLITGILCLLFPLIIYGQKMNYESFDNSSLSHEANSVRFFLEDEQGLLWIGSNNGLYSYDGYNSFPHFAPGSIENRMIYCGLFFEEDYLLLGTEEGILLYNYRYDKYVPFEVEIRKDIRALVYSGKDLWLGCTDGLYRYNFEKKELTEMLFDASEGRMIHSLLEDNGFIYVGTYGIFGRFSLNDYQYEQINDQAGGGRLILSLAKDKTRNCIWIGDGNSLTKYLPFSNTFQKIKGFPVVKSIGFDFDNNIIVGTDNGLYIYNELDIKSFSHDAQKANSLTNNIIWSVFRDSSDNIWLGTDYGFSMAPRNRLFDFIPIYQFSGTGEGNRFYSIFKDSKGFYWLGGDNGLIRTRNISTIDKEFRWYNMGEREFSLPHSNVRDIFEDTDHNLWIATDQGIGNYNYDSGRFTMHYLSHGNYTANWAYDIQEDSSGDLWISSFDGGLFKINKGKLSGKQDKQAVETHYSKADGLNSNNIDQSVFDNEGNIWALNRNYGLNVIDVSTGEVTSIPIHEYTKGNIPGYLIRDSDGNIWVGHRNGITRINPVNKQVDAIEFENADNAVIMSLLQVENNIWASSTEGLWIIDKNEFSVNHIGSADKVFYSMYYDQNIAKILLGGYDGIAVCSPTIHNTTVESARLIISSIIVNNNRYVNSDNELAVRYNNKIQLPFNQNNLIIEFSDLQYSKENRNSTYVFKLGNDDENWIPLKANDNLVYLNKLDPGTHNLKIARQEPKKAQAETLSFQIIIDPPWYLSWLARIIYIVFFAGLIVWTIMFYAQKNRLKFARIAREKTLEQTKLKIDFFTNIAHEFKTPLSLIIAPLGGLINNTKSNKEKDTLEMIRQNAMKLNSLIQQAINYYRDDSKVPMGLILSKVEFVEFARSIFATYKENMKNRQIEFIFHSDSDKVFVELDVLKIESVLNNLLSNACKYTNEGDTIILSLKYSSEASKLEIRISDTGIGIPEKDLPFIFQRFFQSPLNGGRDGTGIGLYLVKNFTELHGGSVKVISNTEEGTSFIVILPVKMGGMAESPGAGIINNTESDEKPLLVIVEDNAAIASFISGLFVGEFRCVIACNGKSGLKICTELKPDIIISDIMMPVMDGLEMCQRLKKNIPTSTIPLVLLTAKDDKETEFRSINLKIDAFIAKPFDSDILYSRVKQLLEVQKQLKKKIGIEKLSDPIEEQSVSADEKFLAFITKVIEHHIADPDLNITFLCNKANVTPKQLYRKIKQLTGLTAVDYIKSIRMKKAAILFSNKNFTVAEVMYKVGFSNHSYFSKCFVAEFGKTPRQFIAH
jgi:signal transduction histidine kinase/ligand-binding sensor domain-containing protein/DNA-binding response OmpR family regulator